MTIAILLLTQSVWCANCFVAVARPNDEFGEGNQETTSLSLGTRAQGIDWPRMLGPDYDSHSPETGILKSWPKEGLRVVWSAPTGVGYGNGVAAHGRWFQFDRFEEVEQLSCLNAETGAKLWTWKSPVEYSDPYGYNNGPRSSPVVDGERVYVLGVTGSLACLSVRDGAELWKLDTNTLYNVYPNFFGVGASPLIYQDKLIVMIGGCKKNPRIREPTINDIRNAQPDGAGIVAFDKTTGKELYRVGNHLASYSAPVLAQIDGSERGLALMRDGLMVFDPDKGTELAFYPWRASILESVNAASPTIVQSQILVSECYEIGCSLLTLRNNKLNPSWRDDALRKNQTIRAHWSTPLVDGNTIYASSGRNEPDTDLRCVQIDATGTPKVKWTHRNRDRSTGLIVDGHIVLLGESGLLQLIKLNSERLEVVAEMDLSHQKDPSDGRPYITTPSWAPPVLSHGLLYVRGTNKVTCLELIPN